MTSVPPNPAVEQTRPRGLATMIAVMCVFNVLSPFVVDRRDVGFPVFLVVCLVFGAASFAALWFLWNGRNWARWLVIVTSVLALTNVFWIGDAGPAERALLIAEALLGACLIYWLNTDGVRLFFKRPESSAASPPVGRTNRPAVARRPDVRIAVRSHLEAGCFAVAGIAILSAGYLFPTVLRGAGKSSLDGVVSIAMVILVSLALAVAVWLLFYVPLSSAAERMAASMVARMKLSALLCTIAMVGCTLGLLHRFNGPTLFLLMASVVFGLGGALYAFFRGRIALELSEKVRRAS